MADPKIFKRGARPTPRHKLAGARPFCKVGAVPDRFAIIPKQLSVWGNDAYGDCVTAEEAFKCACDQPEDFIPDAEVQRWAEAHGVLNGADLLQVIQWMQAEGFKSGGNTYTDGTPAAIDYSQPDHLQAALLQGPVKIGIDANALPSGAGQASGWYAFGKGNYPNEDHCVALCGYGPASWCFQLLGVALPQDNMAGIDPNKLCFLLFTWGTIGVVDHDWLMGTCQEAWIRQPNTIINGQPTPIPPDPIPQPAPVLHLPAIPVSVSGPLGHIYTGQTHPVDVPLSEKLGLPPWLLTALRLAVQYGVPIGVRLLSGVLAQGPGYITRPDVIAWIEAAVIAEKNHQPLPPGPPI